jgi:type VI secretion system protein ImpA
MLRPMNPIGVDFVAQLSRLAEPIAVGNACGSALDDTQALAALEAYRVFGRIKAAGDEPAILQVLQRMQQMLAPYVLEPAGPSASDVGESSSAGAVGGGMAPKAQEVGTIASRQDVLRALDAVMSYYRSNEPGSLVPMLAERAKRLVSTSFFEALAEVAPEVVDPVKKAVGVRDPSV